jgi:hypothetical protein
MDRRDLHPNPPFRLLTDRCGLRAVNVTKKEYVTPCDIGGTAKLWEWCANNIAGIGRRETRTVTL